MSEFDENYFHTEAYAEVSFEKYSQYWWSNRFYALLARKHGPKRGRVLEVGCGLGHLMTFLTDRYEVYGGDINEHALQEARRVAPEANIAAFSAEDLSMFPDAGFQIVICKHIVEHLPHPEKAIAEMGRVLAPGGLLLLATPNLDAPMHARLGENWIGYKDPTHISMKTATEWLKLIKGSRMQPRKVFTDGFWAPPYVDFLPLKLQKLIFGAPGGIQAVMGWSVLPLSMGESVIVLAEKLAT
ncbi:MAG: class I SAM-dependent methyltransferase [Anaerolineales bacterium]|nr:class I SAM-dependent methyltransferase [Anaerolineales bacterium]